MPRKSSPIRQHYAGGHSTSASRSAPVSKTLRERSLVLINLRGSFVNKSAGKFGRGALVSDLSGDRSIALGAAPAFWGRWWPVAARAQQQRSAARIGVLLVGLSIVYRVIGLHPVPKTPS